LLYPTKYGVVLVILWKSIFHRCQYWDCSAWLKFYVYCILFSFIANECYRRFQNSLLCTEDTRLYILFNRKKQNIASY